MRIHWRVLLPTCGLLLFAFGTFELYRDQPVRGGRYFWWASIRLDTDPLNKRVASAQIACKQEVSGTSESCLLTDPIDIWIEPGWLARVLILAALPAFFLEAGTIAAMSRIGVSQLLTFMISMPLFIFAWFYFIGWLLDRCRNKRRLAQE
jgi:hypothetical protein